MFNLSHDGSGSRRVESNPEYVVEWEFHVQPVARTACPFEVWLVASGAELAYVAIGFDSWLNLADRVGVTSTNTRFVFGFEPTTLSMRQLQSILSAIYAGNLEARYTALFRRLFSAHGRLLVDVGLPLHQNAGGGRVFRYSSYAA
ncbi:MAG: hypothetical protein V9G29_03095 [Burkholderiaceae bacterium]